MSSISIPRSDVRPRAVIGAVALLVLDAVAGAASVHVLFWLSPSNNGLVLPFQPGVWLLALLQVLVALMAFRGLNWARWLAAVAVALLVGDSLLNTNISARLHSFPAATIRDLGSYVVEVSAVLLMFLPSSSAWFRSAPHSKRAA